MPAERLEREITELAAHVNAATCRWLLLVGEFDHRGVWAEWGCRSCADWLSYRCGVSPSTGRQQVRVARLLAEAATDPGDVRAWRAVLFAGPGA
jgi:hypothetical protein